MAVCLAGGKKEVGLLASQLRMSFRLDKKKVTISEETLERQCDREFLESVKNRWSRSKLSCPWPAGPVSSFWRKPIPRQTVYPGVNTTFIGVAEAAGLWTERCRACGDCLLAVTGGICPQNDVHQRT